MNIDRLSINGFRNLNELTAEFDPGINIFYGDNGTGKTNLLEAIFTLCLARSQRGAADAVMLGRDSEFFRLSGDAQLDNHQVQVAVAYQKGGRKKITIDSVPSKASELYERFSVVSSGPEDSDILSGPPSARRTFMDIYLSQMSPGYLSDLSDYQQALAQKNGALRNDMDPSPFDPLLVQFGVRVMTARLSFLDRLAPTVKDKYATVSAGEDLTMRYHPRVAAPDGETDTDSVRQAFENALVEARERERARQTAVMGPHRDEIEFSVAGLPARTHGSQGQWRTAAVCLKLAVFELLKEKRKVAPILLLDEIFAELDLSRSRALMETLAEAGQIFLTTAVEPPESIARQARRFKIVRGAIQDVN
jgi:DNA replication and repair protein RecF